MASTASVAASLTANVKALLMLWLLCCHLQTTTSSSNNSSSRRKRYLIYPENGSTAEYILGFGIPLLLPHHSLTIGVVLKCKYPLPTNSTEYTQPYLSYQKRSLQGPTRWGLYSTLQDAINRLGYDGRACLLRSICEASETPLSQHNGLAGELLHVLLTPSTSGEPVSMYGDREFRAAELEGAKPGSNCRYLYSECPLSLLDLITELHLV